VRWGGSTSALTNNNQKALEWWRSFVGTYG
jgi:hypothetical protein